MNNHTCPHCGGDITQMLKEIKRAETSKAGATMTDKKRNALKNNAEKMNKDFTSEKRSKAAMRIPLEVRRARAQKAIQARWGKRRGSNASKAASKAS